MFVKSNIINISCYAFDDKHCQRTPPKRRVCFFKVYLKGLKKSRRFYIIIGKKFFWFIDLCLGIKKI